MTLPLREKGGVSPDEDPMRTLPGSPKGAAGVDRRR